MDKREEGYVRLVLAVLKMTPEEARGDILPIRESDRKEIDRILDVMDQGKAERSPAKIINMMFGLDGNDPYTRKEIGQFFSFSWNRADQLYQRGLRLLRDPSRLPAFQKIFRSQLESLIERKEVRIKQLEYELHLCQGKKAKQLEKDRCNEWQSVMIDELRLSIHATKTLKMYGVLTLEDLAKKTEKELFSKKGFGEKTLRQIKDTLSRYGLSLAQPLE